MNIKPNLDILNLVQHVELNRVGWWDEVVDKLILATLWMEGKENPKSIDYITLLIEEYFDINLNQKIDYAINELHKKGDLVLLSNGNIKLSEESTKKLAKQVDSAEIIITNAKNVFIEKLSLVSFCTNDKEDIWRNFNENFLKPFIKSVGANIYDMLNGKPSNIDQSLLDEFLSTYPSEQKGCIQNASREFMYSNNPNVRSYILRFLNAYFCIEASGLDNRTLEILHNSLDKPQDIRIFIDTNFLFSILELHENPSNDAAVGLLKIINSLNNKINVKLYLLDNTLREAKVVLQYNVASLNNTRITPNLADAGKDFVSGIAKKFFIEVNRTKTPLSPMDYFSPYIDNLMTVVRKKGIEIFNEDISDMSTRQDVIDDILDQSHFEEQKWGADAKSYKALEHDVILWHFIKDKRAINLESPLDARYWATTIDFRLLAFDEYKVKKGESGLPLFLHPTTLIQLLQFWVPRSQLLEDTLFSSLWLPFIFQDLDPDSENLTIQIINTLGRFENVGDLPRETIVNLLVNNALRQKIKNEEDVDKKIKLIREALIEQNRKIKEEAELTKSKNLQYQEELKEKKNDLAKLNSELEKATSELKHEREKREQLSKEFSGLKREIEEKEKISFENKIKQKYLIRGLLLPFSAIIILFILGRNYFSDFLPFVTAGCIILLILWVWIFDYYGNRNQIIKQIPIFKRIHSIIKWSITIIGAIILSLISNAIYDYLKSYF